MFETVPGAASFYPQQLEGMPMHHSAEVRWFFAGSLPEDVQSWFTSKPEVSAEAARIDSYLPLSDCTTVGVKLRNGRFEIKALRQAPREAKYSVDALGLTDSWVKWSLDDPIVPDLAKAMTSGSTSLIKVEKRRWLRRFSLEQDRPQLIDADAQPQNGCLFEIVALTARAKSFWSIGLEAFGSPDKIMESLEKTASHAFKTEPPPRPLRLAASCSYPVWLAKFATQG